MKITKERLHEVGAYPEEIIIMAMENGANAEEAQIEMYRLYPELIKQ